MVDSTGALYVSEYNNHRVRKITTDGKISTVVGTDTKGFGGDCGPAASAQLNRPRGGGGQRGHPLHRRFRQQPGPAGHLRREDQHGRRRRHRGLRR
ncbi:hypothetical protein [Streptomyces noursei]|uniref:hypothetical protein n=1 Tax=Streptomyces noursei TaxID=1971 RepID=UPI0037DA01FC